MNRFRIATALSAALSLSLLLATPATSAEIDPTTEAQASLLAAAVLTDNLAESGFHSVLRISGGTTTYKAKLEAWTRLDGTAAVREVAGDEFYERKNFTGSTFDWGSGPRELIAWSQLNPGGPQDEKIMRLLPRGTKYSTAPAPALTEWGITGWGFSASQVKSNLSSAGYLPWNVSALIAMCGKTVGEYSVACTGMEETIAGEQKIWRFEIIQTYSDDTWPVTVTAESDGNGHITKVEYFLDETGMRSVLTATLSSETTVPLPDIRKKNSISSRTFTKTVAETETRDAARDFRTMVTMLLKASDKKMSNKNLAWAFNQLMRDGFPFWDGGSQWNSGIMSGVKNKVYEFSVMGDDGITQSSYYAYITVKNGQMQTSFASKPMEFLSKRMELTTAKTAPLSSPAMPSSPWLQG